jgi:hypothetical protein
MPALKAIQDAHLVSEHFGSWPTFHDAEVLFINLDRHAPDGETSPVVTLGVHGFLISADITPRGLYRTTHHAVVTFEFYGVANLKLEGFGYQNSLMGISFTDLSKDQLEDIKLEVVLTSSFGVDANFLCRHARVLSVEPGVPAGSQYSDHQSEGELVPNISLQADRER